MADWKIEARQMHNVYANGLLSLAASMGQNGDTGLFRHRDPDVCCKSVSVLDLPRGQVVLIPEPDLLAGTIIGGPLAKRGWVLQEQLLAPRILHFGEQLFWECDETWACETLTDGLTGSLIALGNPGFFSIRRRITAITLKRDPNIHWTPSHRQETLYDIWDTICADYSKRDFTVGKDRLIAIAGIAEHFKPLLSTDDFAAGLWRNDFIPGLLWCAEPSSSTLQAKRDHSVPSWSWLLQDIKISYSWRERRRGYKIARLGMLYTDTGTDIGPEPPLRDNCVTISGTLRHASLRCIGGTLARDRIYEMLFDGYVAMISGRLQKGTNRAKIVFDYEEQIVSDDCYFLPLIIFEDEDRKFKILNGILLRCNSAGKGSAFRRIGYFETTAYTRLFYRAKNFSLVELGHDNPWDVLDSYPQERDEMMRGNDLLPILNKDSRFISRAELQHFLGSYPVELFRPLQEQTIMIS
jgi:hypothetical protein